jgi:inorganic pyrophosphatase
MTPEATLTQTVIWGEKKTWEDPHHTTPETHTKGDNDPLDACEIGRAVASPGDVKQVKVLGILCLIDKGETDWKVLVIDVHDPLAGKVNDIGDVDRYFPGLLDASRDWWRVYRVPDGKGGNEFGFEGRWLDRK